MRLAAVHLNFHHHLLDHIAPLCAEMQMPLYVTDDPDITLKYYPQIELIHWPDFELRWSDFVKQRDVVFRCGYWSSNIKETIRALYQKDLQFIFCPHGQSEKGLHSSHLHPYQEQETILLYGQLMEEMLKKLDLLTKNQKRFVVGNYRLAFYQRYKQFYDNIVKREILSHLDLKKRTLLYAPTWDDAEESSSFYSFTEKLIASDSSNWNIIIKPHPLLQDRDPGKYQIIFAHAFKKKNILILNDFPPIYPLLQQIDVYVGDHSSMGYDFLHFERPMFFVPTARRARLMQCGETFDKASDPIQFIEAHLHSKNRFVTLQRSLYQHAFARVDFSNLRNEFSKGRQNENDA